MPGLPKNVNALQKWMQSRVTHGGYLGGRETPEHYIWRSMISRCTNKNAKDYDRYGGSGVTVCLRWQESFTAFLEDMGHRPDANYQIDRINPAGNYEPNNCRWTTRSTQQKNKRMTKRYEFDGVIGTSSEHADRIGISRPLASWRVKNWGTFEKGKKCLLQKAG